MEKKITFKTMYLLLVITVGLLGLGLGSTYAMFILDAEIVNPIAFSSNLSYDGEITQTIDITLKPTEMKDFSLTVKNNTGETSNYAIVYLDENYNIDIYGKIGSSTCKSIGTLENGKTCLFNGTVRNDSSEEVILTIAVLSSDSSLILASNMETIPLRENLVTHITNLYTNATKTKVTNNEIEYNYATSESLMNDRLGGTTEDLNGGNIRYYGANPNNYIYFNCTDYDNQTSDTCELWRIIGIFDGKVKIKSPKNAGDMVWNNIGANDWTVATLNTYLNTTYYDDLKNDETKEKILTTTWDLGAGTHPFIYSNQIYAYERGYEIEEEYVHPTTEWTGRIAPMYASDFGYAVDFNLCKGTLNDYIECSRYNWIFGGTAEWTLTPTMDDSVYYIENNGYPQSYARLTNVTEVYSVYPTLYLNSDELIQSGTGSESNPYQLSSSYGKYFNGETDYVDMGYTSQSLGQSITIGARFKPNIYGKSDTSYVVTNLESGGIGLAVHANGYVGVIIRTDTMSAYKWIIGSDVITNKYYTAVATYDGQTVKLYIDGREVASESVTGNIKITPVPFYVGANSNPNSAQEYFKGRISDAFMTSKVLDVNAIANNFTNTFIYDKDDSTYFYYHLS